MCLRVGHFALAVGNGSLTHRDGASREWIVEWLNTDGDAEEI
jgi:hypothetical protein